MTDLLGREALARFVRQIVVDELKTLPGHSYGVVTAYADGVAVVDGIPGYSVPAILRPYIAAGDQVRVYRAPGGTIAQVEDITGDREIAAPSGEANPTLEELDALGLTTDTELADHKATPSHWQRFNTPNTYTTHDGEYALIGQGTIGSQYGEVTAHARLSGGGRTSIDYCRGTFTFRIRQQAAIGSAPLVSLELENPRDMAGTDLTLVTTSLAGATSFEIYWQIQNQQEWGDGFPLGLIIAKLAAFAWVSCSDFVAALPSGTTYTATEV